jgi:hypothetical protein
LRRFWLLMVHPSCREKCRICPESLNSFALLRVTGGRLLRREGVAGAPDGAWRQ